MDDDERESADERRPTRGAVYAVNGEGRKEAAAGRDVEGERGESVRGHSIHFLTLGQHNSWHGGH